MSLTHYQDRIEAMRRERAARLAAIADAEQARAYQRQVKRLIARAFRPLPPRRTPLEAQVLGRIEERDFAVERVLFASAPGRLVSALCYLPKGRYETVPGVLMSMGHSPTGMVAPHYQSACQDLVRAGYAVFAFDPIHQGERRHYRELDAEMADNPCRGHNMLGKQMELLGDFFGNWRLHDARRALDYLCGRPEVDAERVCMTGCSGGGTMTTWMAGMDRRLACLAPSCFVTTYHRNVRSELPQDVEQCPPGILAGGLELVDFLIAAAPRPTILLGARFDFFDHRGLEEAHGELRRFFRLLGAPATHAECFQSDSRHGFHPTQRQALIAFLRRHMPSPVGSRRGKAAEVLAVDRLQVAPDGDVHRAGSRPIYVELAEEAERLVATRRVPARPELGRRLARLLGVRARMPAPDYRTLSHEWGLSGRYLIDTDPGVRCVLRKIPADGIERFSGWSCRLDAESESTVYLPHCSFDKDLAEQPLIVRLRSRHSLFGFEPRGMGGNLLDEQGEERVQPYGPDFMLHSLGVLFGESRLGRRVHDLLRCIDLLRGLGARRIRLVGRGQGALIACFAGLLRNDVGGLILVNAPLSYRDWVAEPLCAWPAASCARGILRVCDLGDCYRALNRRLRLVEPWGPDMRPIRGKARTAVLARHRIPARLIDDRPTAPRRRPAAAPV